MSKGNSMIIIKFKVILLVYMMINCEVIVEYMDIQGGSIDVEILIIFVGCVCYQFFYCFNKKIFYDWDYLQ